MPDTGLYIGAVEAGGSKFVCAIADNKGAILEKRRIKTDSPAHTLAEAIRFFKSCLPDGASYSAFGIGSFGPICVDASLADYGKILGSPKLDWQDVDMVKPFEDAFPGADVIIDTDVNAAVLGEGKYGAAKHLSHYVYLTIGTGIGGGVVIDDRMIKGRLHLELGHMSIKRAENDDFEGSCPFHKDCVEGLASGRR